VITALAHLSSPSNSAAAPGTWICGRLTLFALRACPHASSACEWHVNKQLVNNTKFLGGCNAHVDELIRAARSPAVASENSGTHGKESRAARKHAHAKANKTRQAADRTEMLTSLSLRTLCSCSIWSRVCDSNFWSRPSSWILICSACLRRPSKRWTSSWSSAQQVHLCLAVYGDTLRSFKKTSSNTKQGKFRRISSCL
jgi:hypothetical protein